jgi:hypothetical protein
MPEVTWYKDGIAIENNPDYQTTFDQGICTLTIEETFTEDSARFICRAVNAAGTAETNATLSVKGLEFVFTDMINDSLRGDVEYCPALSVMALKVLKFSLD